jgi:hypothetical protein
MAVLTPLPPGPSATSSSGWLPPDDVSPSTGRASTSATALPAQNTSHFGIMDRLLPFLRLQYLMSIAN